MDGWRDQELTRTRSNSYRKPPLGGNPNWQQHQGVPSWEKRFCASVGSIPWKKLVETKKFIHLYDNVIKWNDSAGKEAFQTAKNKFYANIHGLPWDNRLPDPDIYIDNIDWDSEVDPNLILDLDSDSVVPDSGSKDEQVVIFGSSFPPSYQSFSPYGWGESDDDKKKDPNMSPEYKGNTGGVVDNNNNWWGWNEHEEKGKEDQDHWGWNMYDNNNCFYDVSKGNMSRYKTSRFTRNQFRRNTGNGRAPVNHGGSPTTYGCAPVNHGGAPAGGGHRWSVKKTIS